MDKNLVVVKELPWLVELTTEVARDATLKVMGGKFSPPTIIKMSDLFAKATYNFMVSQMQKSAPQFEVPMSDFASFTIMCAICQEMEKTIPILGNLKIQCKLVNRGEFQEWCEGFKDAGQADRA